MENKNKEERKKFIKACPVNNCRGFLSQAWKCGICSVNVCSKCHEIKEDNHICDENTLATAKLIANDSKPCPKCASLIYKIEGCDQMFCTSCHTPFSWKTGKIVSGIIHNPHFYQWQREQNGGIAPRVPGDNPCGYNFYEIPYTYAIRQKLRNENKTCPNWEEAHRLVGHIIGIELRRYPNIMGIQDNTDLRINFLSNKIDEKSFLRTLKLRQKKTEKNRAIHQILELFYISAIDIFKTYMNNTISHIETPLFELKKYANNELDKVKNKYSGKIPYISETWQIKTK
jgi:ribosomal protein L32